MKPMRAAIIVGKMDSGGKKNLIMEYYRHIDRDKIQFDLYVILIHRRFQSRRLQIWEGEFIGSHHINIFFRI